MGCTTARSSVQQQRRLQHQQALRVWQALPMLVGRAARALLLLLPCQGWRWRLQLSWQGSQLAPLPSPKLWLLPPAAQFWLQQQANMLPCQAAPSRHRRHSQQQANPPHRRCRQAPPRAYPWRRQQDQGRGDCCSRWHPKPLSRCPASPHHSSAALGGLGQHPGAGFRSA